jgi:biopolymer transport protein ExbD
MGGTRKSDSDAPRSTTPAPRSLSTWSAERMRTRFSPKNRIGHGLVSLAPWFDIILVLLFFVVTASRVAVQPGIVVELPAGEFHDGLRSRHVAVVSLQVPADSASRAVVYYDDRRYVMDAPGRLALAAAWQASGAKEQGLILFTDGAVASATLNSLLSMARTAGFPRVNLAHRTAVATSGER